MRRRPSPLNRPDQARIDLDAWYRRCPGRAMEAAQRVEIGRILPRLYGYHLLQIGGQGRSDYGEGSAIVHRIKMHPRSPGEAARIDLWARPDALPLASDSVSAVVLHHTLEFEDNPHQILREVDRILVDDGYVLIFGFNPVSLWGLWRLLRVSPAGGPWGGRLLTPGRVRDWLVLLGFEVNRTHFFFYRPPLDHSVVMERLGGLEAAGRRLWPALGSGYLLVGRKRVMPLTLIKPRWRPRRALVPGGLAEPTAR